MIYQKGNRNCDQSNRKIEGTIGGRVEQEPEFRRYFFRLSAVIKVEIMLYRITHMVEIADLKTHLFPSKSDCFMGKRLHFQTEKICYKKSS